MTILREKLHYLLKEKLRYNGGLMILSIHFTIFTQLILTIIIYIDGSLTGWGITDGISPSSGLWRKAEVQHINVLDVRAIKIGIYTYCRNKDFLRIRIMCDNVTAINYVNNMGGIKSQTCNNIASRIWDFCTIKLNVGLGSIYTRNNQYLDR